MPHRSPLPMFQEKRRHPRVECNIPVKISGEHGDILTETRNLSCSGALCHMSQRLEPMTKLKIYLLLPLRKSDKVKPKKITCRGVVVRTQEAGSQGYYDTAIFFNDIAPKDSSTISEFIESVMEARENKNGKYN